MAVVRNDKIYRYLKADGTSVWFRYSIDANGAYQFIFQTGTSAGDQTLVTSQAAFQNALNYPGATTTTGNVIDPAIMTVGFPDGTAGSPGIFWNSEPTTGFYRSAAGVTGYSSQGVASLLFGASGAITSSPTTDLTLTGNSGAILTLGNGNTGVAKFIVAASTPYLKVSNVGQSGGAIVFGDGSTAAFNVGVARITSAQASGGSGLGYFSQGAGNAGGHYWYVGDFAFGSNVEAMRLTTGLNLLIGTTTDLPGIAGGLRTNATGASVAATSTTTGQVRFHDASGDVGIGGGNIHASGSLVAGTLNSSGDLLLGVGSVASNFVRVNGPVYSSIISTGTLTHEFNNNSNTVSAALELKLSTAGASANGAWLNITDSGAFNWITGTLRTQGYFVIGSNGDLSSATNHGIRIDSSHNITVPNGNLVVSGATGISVAAAGATVSIKSGANAAAGTVTLVAGTATITSTAIDVNTVIVLSEKTSGGTPGVYQPLAAVSAGSAVITSAATDTSTYNWVAVKVN